MYTNNKLYLSTLILFASIFGGCGRYYRDATDTLYKEAKASTLLKKYEWFKDSKAQLESFAASIKINEKKLKFLEADRTNWNRDDRQNWHQATVELAGIKAAYNNLAAEYNSKMASENWRFCNVGSLPQGSTEPLPRDFAPYKED